MAFIPCVCDPPAPRVPPPPSPCHVPTRMHHIALSLYNRFVLLFGGAIVSPATGVMIVCVHPDLRSWSAAMALFVYNILGYAFAPFLCGILADKFSLPVGD